MTSLYVVMWIYSFLTNMLNNMENQGVLTFYLQRKKKNCKKSVEPSGWSEGRKLADQEGVG